MNMVVLQTKVHAPPARAQLVPRRRLLTALNTASGLDSGPGRKLILISAPAGFGKTTLLGQWLASLTTQPALHIAWLSLDSGDNDPARFFTYLAAAIQVQAPDVGAATLALLQSPLPPADLILSTLINEVAGRNAQAANGAQRLVLILDDYHLITATAIHEAMTFLLEHLPPDWHVIVSSRHDPSFPVARLRGQDQLMELRQSDLRFTGLEAAVFLQEVMSLPMCGTDAGRLAARSEGWASGLQIAALALQGILDSSPSESRQATMGMAESPPAVSAFVDAFSGSHRYVLDYLLEEVLQHQPQDVQRFLMQTSILERLCGSLCDAVVQWQTDPESAPSAGLLPLQRDSRAQDMLEYLESNNLFIVPLDSERRWYRYHHLFADLLQLRLRQNDPDLVPRLHRRACAWYEAAGHSGEAIAHALAAGDEQQAVSLVAKASETAMMRGEVMTVRNWIEALPEASTRSHPRLALLRAWTLFMTGGPVETVSAWLDVVDARAETAGWTAPVRAYILYFQGERQRANRLARQALTQLPEDEHQLRNLANLIRGLTAKAAGDVMPATEAFKSVGADPAGQIQDVLMATLTLCMRAELAARRGDLHLAWDLFQQALTMARDSAGRLRPIASEPLFGLGEVAWQWNKLDQAIALVEEGIMLAKQWSEFAPLDGFLLQARLLWARGDLPGAQRLLDEAAHLAQKFDASELDDRAVAIYQAKLAIVKGDLESAEAWAAAHVLGDDVSQMMTEIGMDPVRKYEYLTLAELRLAQGQTEQALALLDSLDELFDRFGAHIHIRLLQALAQEALGKQDAALERLSRALELAQPAGFVRIFLESGELAAHLLYRALTRGIAPDFVGRLLAAYGEEIAAKPKPSPGQQLVEPLSEREREVLSLVAEGLTNQEIAGRLYLALATVKWHTSNIYGKLGVGNRAEAVARAAQLGLLST